MGKNWTEVSNIRKRVINRTPQAFQERTANYWLLWLNKDNPSFHDLPEEIIKQYKRSLLIMRTNIHENGAVMAAIDSDILLFNKDTYSYTWPRDGAIVAHALDLAGYPVPSRNFFIFCAEVMGREGYFLHKYNPDGSLASSWHSWVNDGSRALPIQEDETALVLWALWEHFTIYRDVEFIKPLYRRLIKAAADFMVDFIDEKTGLPLPSYDLWEERFGVHTFTVCTVIAGLRAAAMFTEAFGDIELSDKYSHAGARVLTAMKEHLYDEDKKCFMRSVYVGEDGSLTGDYTLDMSMSVLVGLKIMPADDKMVSCTMNALHDKLWCKTDVGGMARYERDTYQAVVTASPEIPGNPWIISTLWHAQYLIEFAHNREMLGGAVEMLHWAVARALPSGALPEQTHPHTGAPISVSPLTWSHAEFIITVKQYLKKVSELDG